MADHHETRHLQAHVWLLWAIAGSFRNAHPPELSRAFLGEVGEKVRLLQQNADHHRLSAEGVVELEHLLEAFAEFLTGPGLMISDPLDGPLH